MSGLLEQYYGDEVALFGKDKRQKDPHAFTAGVSYTPFPLLREYSLKTLHTEAGKLNADMVEEPNTAGPENGWKDNDGGTYTATYRVEKVGKDLKATLKLGRGQHGDLRLQHITEDSISVEVTNLEPEAKTVTAGTGQPFTAHVEDKSGMPVAVTFRIRSQRISFCVTGVREKKNARPCLQ